MGLPVVIMAGGKGTRLEPFTRILPKPLIPIGNKPMIEVIMDEYAKYGMKLFYVSVNHKVKIIKAFFEDFDKDYSISYLTEEEPYGTAGALKFLDSFCTEIFKPNNCSSLCLLKEYFPKTVCPDLDSAIRAVRETFPSCIVAENDTTYKEKMLVVVAKEFNLCGSNSPQLAA